MEHTSISALRSLIVVLCSVILDVKGDDPCATANYLNNWRRSVAFEVDPSNKLCDNILEPGWYRITSGQGDRMPTECVEGGFRCNTAVPIWLSNDSLDVGENIFPNEGEVVNRTAYGSHYSGNCYQTTHDIRIKGCNGFLVYYLVPVAACSSAYCFGTEQPCPAGTSSDTEFTPGCGGDMDTTTATL
ncbi:oncoprotein-induced transcript 3 protein-like [Mytilus galloprovincialis]|uniref:oncoprotein-induced transcript 3 protein-like n=1 Tax=Mytilus galloprovincialis TaxID=29158 RepID=UPI003F7CBB75